MSGLAHLAVELAPLVPWPLVAALGAVGLLLAAFGLARRARGTWWRALAVAILVAALLNPSIVQEERDPLTDVAVLLVDDSPSQQIGERPRQTEEALSGLREAIGALPDTELRVVHAGITQPGSQEEGTHLFAPLARALADVPAGRVAGIVVLSDGQVHDVPADLAALGYQAPVHVLLTGRRDEGDRRLTLVRAPSFGLVGKDVTMTVRVDDLVGDSEQSAGGSATVTLMRDGERLASMPVDIGRDTDISVPIEHGGQTVFELAVEEGPRELSLANNAAVAAVSGVRDRLRVLLVSGEPHPGERTWRNLLKADPSVDLVHFTILRPPEKQDGTPINELSLIAFPIRELFEIKLEEFDLIVFDRYRNRGVLPPSYFINIMEYVRKGGALLDSAGESFAGPQGLYYSPLAELLPAEPTGTVIRQGFRPRVTDIGQRHPVTANLGGAGPGQEPTWGRWFRQIDAVAPRGITVMNGADGRPLLVLERFGQGRVAQLLSDQPWLWSRGFEGGGPQAELLRRVAHWLMKEPELEEEDLQASVVDGQLEISRRSLSQAPASVEVTTPSGETQRLTLRQGEDGRATATLPAPEQGLYRVSDGARMAFAASGPLNPLELADLRATERRLAPLAQESEGSVRRLAEAGVPSVRKVRADRDTFGDGWIGLRRQEEYLVRGISQVSLLPALAVLLAGLGALMLAWRREGR